MRRLLVCLLIDLRLAVVPVQPPALARRTPVVAGLEVAVHVAVPARAAVHVVRGRGAAARLRTGAPRANECLRHAARRSSQY